MRFLRASGSAALALAAISSALPQQQDSTANGQLSDALLAVTSDLSKSQPSSDVDPISDSIKQNSAAINQASNGPAGTNANKAANACAVIKQVFPSEYTDSHSAGYTAEVEEPRAINVWQNSTCFFTPKRASDVSVGLKIITRTQSPFSTRGGGHSQNKGWSTITDGVVFDMGGLNFTHLSADKSSAIIGPGNRWGPTYDTLDPDGVALVGGRSPDVGTGLLLGVGIPYLSSKYGLGGDNIKSFEIVLPNSTVVNASATRNSDLYTAQKGGGPNYGIVTKWELLTIPNHMWYSIGLFDVKDVDNIIKAIVQVQLNMESDDNAGIIFAAAGPSILIGFFYAQHTLPPPVFSPFDKIAPLQWDAHNVNGTIAAAPKTFDNVSADRVRFYSRALSYDVDLTTYQKGIAAWQDIRNFSSNPNDTMQFGIQGITAAAVKNGQARGGPNWWGMEAKATNWWHVVTNWNEAGPEIEQLAIQKSTDLWNNMSSIAQAQGTLQEFVFTNDAAGDQPNPLATYGEDNNNKMKAVAAKYDPAQVMQKLQGGGWKLSIK